ncbi:MAG: TldD/PmbA family protein [Deltaproteobacteria bacterium]|jgi:TldD protein|nr:TldD/PmbA family protein [Deltaproteobacteria bacterium]
MKIPSETTKKNVADNRQKQINGVSRRNFLQLSAGATALGVGTSLLGCKNKQKNTTVTSPDNIEKNTGIKMEKLESFGISTAIATKLMAAALSTGGDYCDLYFQRKKSMWLSLEDNSVNKAYTNIDMGVGIRVLKGMQTGYAFSESFDEKSLLSAAKIAASVANSTPGKIPQAFKASTFKKYYPDYPVCSQLNPNKKLKIIKNLEDKIFKKDKRIKKVKVYYSDSEEEVFIMDSQGRSGYDYRPMASLITSCVAENNNRREANYYRTATRKGPQLFTSAKIDDIANQAVNRTVILFDSIAGPVGEMEVVLGPGSSGILLHEAIGHGMEADFARKKITIYTDKLNEKVAPEFVNIYDDGCLDNMRGSINMDDEGNNSQKTQLVENGIFKTFMHDKLSARHFGVKPTGNGRRQSFRHMPLPRMRNTYMTSGPHKPEDIIKSVKKGIYAQTFTNGQVMIGAGDFTFYVKTGYLIEDGKITTPVKDVNIIGNGPEVLADIKMVGNDSKLDDGSWTCGKGGQSVPVGLGIPTVKVGKITVGGTAQ